MTDFLETTVDKFIFRVATDCYYNAEGLWVRREGDHVRVGMSDFLQQRSGDVAFVEVKPEGTVLATGDEVAVIETIKVNVSLTSPVSGKVVEVNPALEMTPEAINQDPYGNGWLTVIEPSSWDADLVQLFDAQAYLALMKGQAEEEMKKP